MSRPMRWLAPPLRRQPRRGEEEGTGDGQAMPTWQAIGRLTPMGRARVPRAGIEMAPAEGLACLDVNSVGGDGQGAVDLFHAFWDGLDELQRAELLAAAMEAGVNLRTDLRGGEEARV